MNEKLKSEQKLTIPKPIDCHIHLRDGDILQTILPDVVQRFSQVIVMPNLNPPVTTIKDALAYRERILTNLPFQSSFIPWMTLYLTESTSKTTIEDLSNEPFIVGCKLYPANVTTNSQSGISDIKKLYPVFECAEKNNIPILIHAESPDPLVDIFDREKFFLEKILVSIIHTFSSLKIVIEHISCKESVDFVYESNENVRATITPHHLLLNRNHLLTTKIHPHHFCLPIVKSEEDQKALIKAATSANEKFMLGSDSAPHLKSQKESAIGPAGIYNSCNAIEWYTEVFDKENQLNRLSDFSVMRACRFYGFPTPKESITLTKKTQQVPAYIGNFIDPIIPMMANQQVSWSLV